MGKWEENKWVWNFKWRQQWFQWELTSMENLIDVVGGVNVMGENDDECSEGLPDEFNIIPAL